MSRRSRMCVLRGTEAATGTSRRRRRSARPPARAPAGPARAPGRGRRRRLRRRGRRRSATRAGAAGAAVWGSAWRAAEARSRPAEAPARRAAARRWAGRRRGGGEERRRRAAATRRRAGAGGRGRGGGGDDRGDVGSARVGGRAGQHALLLARAGHQRAERAEQPTAARHDDDRGGSDERAAARGQPCDKGSRGSPHPADGRCAEGRATPLARSAPLGAPEPTHLRRCRADFAARPVRFGAGSCAFARPERLRPGQAYRSGGAPRSAQPLAPQLRGVGDGAGVPRRRAVRGGDRAPRARPDRRPGVRPRGRDGGDPRPRQLRAALPAAGERLAPRDLRALDRQLTEARRREPLLDARVWAADGSILYARDRDDIGRRLDQPAPVADALARRDRERRGRRDAPAPPRRSSGGRAAPRRARSS